MVTDIMPVTKLCITQVGVEGSRFYVLYNPTDYTIERSAKYAEISGVDANAPSIQFVKGTAEILRMNLFFDTLNAGFEAGTGSTSIALAATSVLPALAKQDVRKYTSQIFDLMLIDPTKHVPPLLKIEWSSLQFTGHLVSCQEKFTKFNGQGTPVRAVLNVAFKQYVKPSEQSKATSFQSPDTSKYKQVHQGDSLWALSAKEYGRGSEWRHIARANGVANPRLLDTGSYLALPAIQ